MKKKHLLFIFLNIVCGNFLFAQTWNGSFDTDWNTPSNWTPAAVPIASGNVVIPASLARYPVLASNVTINGFNMAAGGQLDFKGHTLTITSVNTYNYFSGALNNSDGASDIVINLSSSSGYGSYIRNATVNDNITFNVSGVDAFYDADGVGTANTYNGDVIFNITSALPIYLSYNGASQYKKNLTINRTGTGGSSQLFNGGGNVTGNFKYTNNLNGNFTMGYPTKPTNINGKIDITIKNTSPAYFQVYNITNQTTGGVVDAQSTLGFDIQVNTLKLKSLSITGYTGNQYAYLINNNITSNITIADDATYTTGYGTYLRTNIFTGTTTFNLNGINAFTEADIAASGNHFAGDVSYTVTGTAALSISQSDKSYYDGNLTINRTGAGTTHAFNGGGVVGGNFSFTNNTTGDVTLGNVANLTSLAGKVDIGINNSTPALFQLYRIKNQTTGGIINVQNSKGFDVQQDTIMVNTFAVTGYTGNQYGTLYNNDITGNLTLADNASYNTGYGSYLRANLITGNSNFTINGSNTFYEADNANSGNHFTGDANYNVTGPATLFISHGDTSYYDGNISITRPGAGATQAFNSGGFVVGNLSVTNNTSGNVILGNVTKLTSVGGKVDIAINNTSPANFQLYRVINQTTGGIINVQKSLGFDVQRDSLKVSSMSITKYTGNAYGTLYNNDITGNVVIASDATYSTGYGSFIRSNVITGDATFTNNGSNLFYDADAVGTGNHYTSNVIYNKNSSVAFTVGIGDTTSIGAGLSLNSNAITLGKIQFTGNNDGIVQQSGSTPIIIPTLIMNKGGKAKITLMDSVIATTNLNLKSGIIETGVNSNLVLPDNMTYLGGSDSSYVDGPMLKIGNEAFTFPVGQKNAFAPITITAPGAVSDQFRAQYKNMNPGDVYDSTQKDPTLNHISRAEYWLLDRTFGTSNVSVTIGWANNRSGVVNDIPSLRVTRWDGSKWKDLGQSNPTGTTSMGTIKTAAVVSSFSPFTLASTTVLNPLPINISRFGALRQASSVFLNWSTENEVNFSHFEVERSGNGNNFTSLGQVTAHNITSLQ
ncbi:MAG: hypothetical protein ABI784_03380, partial [Ginsengibacter sp.]